MANDDTYCDNIWHVLIMNVTLGDGDDNHGDHGEFDDDGNLNES